jgi:Fe-Mn family superoxide dismutase
VICLKALNNDHYIFVNEPLPYPFDALEPFVDGKTMELHHDRHLQAYTDNLNAALKNYPTLQTASLEQLIRMADRLPYPLGTQIGHNAGGVYNHRFFFAGLRPDGGAQPSGALDAAITRAFGSFPDFEAALRAAALSVFGSGYAWLVSGCDGRLRIVTTADQDTPLTRRLYPILNIDVWEHAYYLKHYNKRADYFDDWLRVVNWEAAERAYVGIG